MTGYRTYAVAGIIAFLGALQGLDWVTIVQSPSAVGWSAVATGLIMTVLRSVTTTPPGVNK